jgi:formate dehydrogenase major subunit
LSSDQGGLRLTRRGLFRAAAGIAALATLPPATRRALGFTAPKRYRLGEIGRVPIEETVEVKGVCTYCSVGCGIIFYKKGDKVVYLEGDPDNP